MIKVLFETTLHILLFAAWFVITTIALLFVHIILPFGLLYLILKYG